VGKKKNNFSIGFSDYLLKQFLVRNDTKSTCC